ncbi:MAG TPA: O-antigen ligase family protein [Verrucomicrobiae bacterium]|nr:O-antigen ligase family protein [Verrucomicrobiae bacterium]
MDASSVAELRRVDRARLDAWLGWFIGALLIASLVTGPILFGALRDQDFFWIQALGVVAAVTWVVRLWLVPRTIFLPALVWPLAAFCVYAIVRYYTSDVEYLARKEVMRVLFYMVFFVLALNHFRDAKAADIAVAVLLVVCMGLSVWALRQYLTDSKHVWHLIRPSYAHRGSGTFIYPNHFAGFAEMLLALAFGYVFLGTWSKWTRMFFGYCMLWIALGIYTSLSRAGWVATIGALVILMPVLLRNRQRQIVAFAVLVVLLIAGLFAELSTHQITNRLHGVLQNDPITGFHSRRALWHGAYQMWRDHPLWGGGPGHFDERFRAYRTRLFQFSAGQAHCDYLNVLADWGAVGALLLIPALVLYLWPLSKHWIKTVLDPTALNTTTTNYFALTCGGFAGTVALLAHAAVDYQWYAPGVMLTFIAIVAMLIAQTQGARWNFHARLPVTIIVVPLVVLQAIEGAKSFREQYWINKAHYAGSMDERIKNLERAFAVDPSDFRTAYWIGESYRTGSFEGGANYKELAEKAMVWLDHSARLNRFDPYPHMRKAMCLDWLKRYDEGEREIQTALALDPEHYLVLSIAGWHYFQVGDDTKSVKYFIASNERNQSNPMPGAYFRLLDERFKAKQK